MFLFVFPLSSVLLSEKFRQNGSCHLKSLHPRLGRKKSIEERGVWFSSIYNLILHFYMKILCWFQSSLLLAALPRDHRLLFQSCSSQLWLYYWAASLSSWIEFNCLRSAAVGKAARLSIYWQDVASAASGACAVVQISSSKRQCGEQASLKAALLPPR